MFAILQNRNTQIEDLRDVIQHMHTKILEQSEIENVNSKLKDEINNLRKQLLINDLNALKIKKDQTKSGDKIDTARTNET